MTPRRQQQAPIAVTPSPAARAILAAASDWITVRALYESLPFGWGTVKQLTRALHREGELSRREAVAGAGERGRVRFEYRRARGAA